MPRVSVPKRARSSRTFGEECNGRIRDDSRPAVLAAVEHHLREDGEVGRGAEETGMAGDAAQRECVLVVHFALEGIAARGMHFGWRDAPKFGPGRQKTCVGHFQRPIDFAGGKFLERCFADALDDFAEQKKIDIAVAKNGSRVICD